MYSIYSIQSICSICSICSIYSIYSIYYESPSHFPLVLCTHWWKLMQCQFHFGSRPPVLRFGLSHCLVTEKAWALELNPIRIVIGGLSQWICASSEIKWRAAQNKRVLIQGATTVRPRTALTCWPIFCWQFPWVAREVRDTNTLPTGVWPCL